MAARKPMVVEMGNDRAVFMFKFIEQAHVPMIEHLTRTGPAFEEAPLQSIIDCRTPLDNFSGAQSIKLVDMQKSSRE